MAPSCVCTAGKNCIQESFAFGNPSRLLASLEDSCFAVSASMSSWQAGMVLQPHQSLSVCLPTPLGWRVLAWPEVLSGRLSGGSDPVCWPRVGQSFSAMLVFLWSHRCHLVASENLK